MKQIAENSYIDEDTGELVLRVPGPDDPFAPPGVFPPLVMQRTGWTFQQAYTVGGVGWKVWSNNSLQFATPETAARVVGMVQADLPGYLVELGWDREEGVIFRRPPIAQIVIRDARGGLIVRFNAGEWASKYARWPVDWVATLKSVVADALRSRDTE